MMTGIMHDQNMEKHLEKQMGCMAGFLQLFDRNQMLAGKRLYTTKSLTPATEVNASPAAEMSVGSPVISQSTRSMTSPSPDRYKPPQSPKLRSSAPDSPSQAVMPAKLSLAFPIHEVNEGTRYSWKFCKETPRLSLDSRAVFDSAKQSLHQKEIQRNDGADDKSRRSTSVIAKLMGLEPLTDNSSSTPDSIGKQSKLRRCASESRTSIGNKFNNLHLNQQNQSHSTGAKIRSNVIREKLVDPYPRHYSSQNSRPELARASNRGFKSSQQRKSFFDSADFFPEPKQNVSIHGEIERRLRIRGIDEQSKDLETLKQILEAMQLKGLLHSPKPSSPVKNKNFVYDRSYSFSSSDDQCPIVLMKPSSPSRSKSEIRRTENIPVVSPRRERQSVDRNMKSPTRARNVSSPTRSESNVKNSSSRTKQLSTETQRRVSPVNSPRITRMRNVSDQTATNRQFRNRKPTAQICTTVVIEDESSSSISECTVSTPSQTDTERSKTEECKDGTTLPERCDKLLHSIAVMNSTELLQPSPVSVLDSSFYKDDSSSPSPVMKRSISFTDESVEQLELEEDLGSSRISSIRSKCEYEIDDSDFVYISEILRASVYLSEEADIFLLLEKQQYIKGKNMSKISRLQRKLIFETITEILDRNKHLPPWKAFTSKKSSIVNPSLQQIWSEFQRIREREKSDDLFETICGVLKKDLAGDGATGWGGWPVEMSEAVLDIERLIFKDLVGETIRDLAEFAGKSNILAPRRKLVF